MFGNSCRRVGFESILFWSLLALAGCGGKPASGGGRASSGGAGDEGGAGNGTGGKSQPGELEGGGNTSTGGKSGTVGGATGASTMVAAVCGNGLLTADETCDDANTADGDGCAGNCQSIDADYACPTPGKACVPVSICGDKKVTGSENCDDGNGVTGDGCSSKCRVEDGFTCSTIGAACRPNCGDGLVRGSERCDDGNETDGDGCTANCTVQTPTDVEAKGWVCTAVDVNSPSVCVRTNCGDGTPQGTEQCDDGNNDMGDGCTPYCRLEPKCTYSSAGCKTACGDGMLLAVDTDQACDDGNTVGGDGCSATCQVESGFVCDPKSVTLTQLVLPVVLRDFKACSPATAGTTTCTVANGHPDFQNLTTSEIVSGIVQSTLDRDKKPAHVNKVVVTTANTYAADGTLTSPDYFSYWYRDNNDPVTGYNRTVVQTLTLSTVAAGYQFSDTTFFPLDGVGWGDSATSQHNFYFTSEVRYWFQYQGGESLEFIGDDDVWVFVNGQLTVDLGGIHGARGGKIEIDGAGNGLITTCPSGTSLTASCNDLTTKTIPLSMTVGGVYEIAVFQAERRTTQSNYKLTLGSFDTPRSVCKTVCGDAIVSADEACDLGTAKNTGAYGTCNPDCTLPAFCGDAKVDAAAGEACDNGSNLSTYGYNGKPACNANCLLTDFCGDKIVDSLYGEECDDGNNVSGDGCETNCTHRANCGDGKLDSSVGEECDDGNTRSGDRCSEFCTIEDETVVLT